MLNVPSLAERIQTLQRTVDTWNTIVIALLACVAFATAIAYVNQRKLTDAQAQLIRANQQVFANRRIPAIEWDRLATQLATFAGQNAVIEVYPATFEQVYIAEEIRSVLLKAGWHVSEVHSLTAPPEMLGPQGAPVKVSVQGTWFQATPDPRSQAAAREAFNVLSPYTGGIGYPAPLSNPENPRVWILVGDRSTP
jgi:cell division protein FtsL